MLRSRIPCAVAASLLALTTSCGGGGSDGSSNGPPQPGLSIVGGTGLSTTEAGGTATFDVKLNTAPTDTVTVMVSSGNAGEVVASPLTLVFDATTWDTAQTVTLTGQDDAAKDGDVAVTVTLTSASTDANYGATVTASVTATNVDDDIPGVAVSTTTVTTTEAGAAQSFTVALQTAPTAEVVVTPASTDTAEATVSAALHFTAGNWNTPQTVWVTSHDDTVGNEPIRSYQVTLTVSSGDADYHGIAVLPVAGANHDNDSPGFVLHSPTLLYVTEAPGSTATFTVVLTTQPAGDVTFALQSDDLTEGTVVPAGLTFTPGNWNVPQTVTVSSVLDHEVDGEVLFHVTATPSSPGDAAYAALPAQSIAVRCNDQDLPGFTATASGSTTTEAGGTRTIGVALKSMPPLGSDVTIRATSSDLGEGTVSPETLVFTRANWGSVQTFTVTGVDDSFDDGDIGYRVTLAPSFYIPAWGSVSDEWLQFTNTDDDEAGYVISKPAVTVSEVGTATFTVKLSASPVDRVDLVIGSTGVGASPSQVSFTPANWNVAQTITISGWDNCYFNDPSAQNEVRVSPPTYPSEFPFGTVTPVSVPVTVIDDESAPAFVFTPSSLTTTEGVDLYGRWYGTPATVQVKLTTCPRSGTVPIAVSYDTTHVAVVETSNSYDASPFSNANWFGGYNGGVTFTATPVQWSAATSTILTTVTISATPGASPEYVGKTGTIQVFSEHL